MPRPPETLAIRLKNARELRGLTQGELAEAAGMKQPDISKIERGLILQTTGIARLAKALKCSSDWLELGIGEQPGILVAEPDVPYFRDASDPNTWRRGVAHDLSQVTRTLPSTTEIEWGDLMGELPHAFVLRVRDDSMEPLLNPGDAARFRRATLQDVKPGQRVLVADRDKNHYIREYRARRPGHWQAVPLKERAYDPLDSIVDGLEVLAVLTGVDWAE